MSEPRSLPDDVGSAVEKSEKLVLRQRPGACRHQSSLIKIISHTLERGRTGSPEEAHLVEEAGALRKDGAASVST